ncbi:MAG: biotin/lipoyl-binding protein, partial [Deltaproteobacteria bacterium]|nr:biotin/lipoyl-binding protein [Deltaproteobacteria bacterium]
MRIWRRLAFELHGRWPWGIWLLVLAATLWLFDERGRSLHALGMAEVRQIPLSPLSPARIASIEVDLGQLVDAGEVLVRLDTSLLDAEMAIVEAEIRRLDEELSKELLLRTQEQLDQASRLTSTAEQAALELVQAHTRSARNRAELELMEGEITRQEKLVAQQLAPMDLLSELKRQRAALVEDNSGGERSIRLLEQHVADSISRLDRWRSLLSPAAATPPGGRQPRPPSDGQASASA